MDPDQIQHTPNILLVATSNWPSAARLAIAFVESGCRVRAVCPGGQLAMRTTVVAGTQIYRPLAPLSSLRKAMRGGDHDLVVPCDDLASSHLRILYNEELRFGRETGPLAVLLKRSFGAPAAIALVAGRSGLMQIAREEGIATPQTQLIETTEDLRNWLKANQLPAIIKADGTAGGRGVRVVPTRAFAERAFQSLKAPPTAFLLAKCVIVDRDLTLVWPFLSRKRPLLCIQSYISGRDATASIACWEGKLLAGINYEVIRVVKENGPASVVRIIENPQMWEAATKLVRRLNLSGLYGLDFRIDRDGLAHLIEMNPRATQSSHLRLGPNRDLVGALVGALQCTATVNCKCDTTNSTIALFPNEWRSDPTSESIFAQLIMMCRGLSPHWFRPASRSDSVCGGGFHGTVLLSGSPEDASRCR